MKGTITTMKRAILKKRWRLVLVCLGLALFFISGCAKTTKEVRPDKAIIDPASIKPGLAVLYFEEFYRHINEMPTGETALKEGKPGKPIPYINHRFGDGPVYDSGRGRGVGVQMTGFIRFSSAGRYLIKAKSNDGIRIFINKKMIIDDPIVHAGGDRFSGEALVMVDKPGWYSFLLQYFQRKGTSMLELYWQLPGQTDYSIVPAEAFGHVAVAGKTD
jgi:hypothetical protein